MFYSALDKWRQAPFYGMLCSEASCGFFSRCTFHKSDRLTWYPDKIKEALQPVPTGIKTCDNLLIKDNCIYLFEIKSRTRDINAKLQGTYNILQLIGCNMQQEDLHKVTMYVVRCRDKNPNVSFRDSLNKLRNRNISSYIYDNNTYFIEDVEIPIKYCKECSSFFNSFFA